MFKLGLGRGWCRICKSGPACMNWTLITVFLHNNVELGVDFYTGGERPLSNYVKERVLQEKIITMPKFRCANLWKPLQCFLK